MSVVTFKPSLGDDIVAAGVWPDKVIDITEGGLIELQFWGASRPVNHAVYRDRFGEEYMMVRLPTGVLVADVRED